MVKKWSFLPILGLLLFGFISDTPFNYFPKNIGNQIISHHYYTLSFNQNHQQADWVAYQITDSTAFGATKRTNSFKEDPSLPNCILKPSYENSGYDRGHLCPAGSMAFNSTAMSESFYMTNMSPQIPGFNRGIWKSLETQIRSWGYEYQSIYVVTGPVLTEFIDTIGIIPVPKYYFKVILDYQEPEFKAIGFLLENKSSSSPLATFATSIDSIELVTGINFFHELPDSIENALEGKYHPELWSWNPIVKPVPKNELKTYPCNATTISGTKCSRQFADSNSYCWQHKVNLDPIVWVCGKSKIYHTSINHRGIKKCKKDLHELKTSEAIELGLRPCKD